MPKLPKQAERTIERPGRPGKTITGPVPDRSGYRASKQKEQSQP
jgi:hypothetical protein